MGQHAWLLFATILTELLIIFKWSRGQFPEPAPFHVKLGWAIGSLFLVGYPLLKVSTREKRESEPILFVFAPSRHTYNVGHDGIVTSNSRPCSHFYFPSRICFRSRDQ